MKHPRSVYVARVLAVVCIAIFVFIVFRGATASQVILGAAGVVATTALIAGIGFWIDHDEKRRAREEM